MVKEKLDINTKKVNSNKDTQENDLTRSLNDINDCCNCEMTLNMVQQNLETFRTTVVSELQKKMENMIEDTIQEMFAYKSNINQFKDVPIWTNRIHTVDGRKDNRTQDNNEIRKLPEKVFLPRQSYLTVLIEVKHIRPIYHIFLVIFSVCLMQLFVHDLIVKGKLNFGFGTIQTAFGKFHFTIVLWCCMQAWVLGLYYGFKVWAEIRFSWKTNKSLQRLWNYFCLMIFIAFQMSFGYVFPILTVKIDLPLGDSSILLLEMIRLMMKMHAFVRSNVAIQLNEKTKADNDKNEKDQVSIPAFSKYLYFLFAPTLIYKDNYPRTKQIHWGFVMKNALELTAVIFFLAIIYELYAHIFQKFGKEKITVSQLIEKHFRMIAPGFLCYVCGFYSVIHTTQNLVGELIKFADRMFYKDWWTITNLEAYFRNWNIIIHDWLYEYVYKDLYMYVFKGDKTTSGTVVILISAIVHEYVLSFIFRFVYPVMFVIFGVVSLIVLRFQLMGKGNSSIGNFFYWLGVALLNGLFVSLYAMEYNARQNCPVGDSFRDYFVPVSWWCNGITNLK